MKTKYLPVKYYNTFQLWNYPSFHRSGSISGMKKLYYGENALLVRCGEYIYNVTENEKIYYQYAH